MVYVESIKHMPPKLTTEIITAAIEGFQTQRARIDAQIADLRALLDGRGTVPVTTAQPLTRRRRKMSAAARKLIGDAQRKRWALSKRQSDSSLKLVSPGRPKRKRKLSAAGRKAIVAATKKRWAAIRAAKEMASQSAATKTSRKKAA